MNTSDLTSKVTELEQQIKTLQSILKAFGLPVSTWISVADAARIGNVSRQTVGEKIKLAIALDNQKPVREFYGVYFRDISSDESEKPAWQVNIFHVNSLLGLSNKFA